MTGLVPMQEYRRVVEKCERLEIENADLRRDARATKGTGRLVAVCRKLGLTPSAGRMVISLADSDTVVSRECLLERMQSTSTHRLLYTQASRIRAVFEDHGGPEGAIQNMFAIGYQMTPAAKEWLRQTVPDAFPQQQRGPNR